MYKLPDSAPTRKTFLQAAGAAAGSCAVLASGVRFASAQEGRLPLFSWNTVPCAVDLAKATGDFSPSEANFLANRFSYVAIEKFQATGPQPKGNKQTEPGIVAAAKALKAANPNVKVLSYWSLFAFHPEYAASANFDQSWIKTHNASNQIIFDLDNPAFQSWWINAANEVASLPGVDGVFVDSLGNFGKYNPIKHIMLEGVRNHTLPGGKSPIIVANGFPSSPSNPQSFLDVLDGLFYEHFDAYESTAPDKIRLDMLNLQQVARAGRILHFRGWPGFTGSDPVVRTSSYAELVAIARKNIDFPLACFLSIAEPGSFFHYAWGYNNIGGAYVLQADMQTVDPVWYPELLRPLGNPKGECSVNGYLFTRQFEHADVRVDVAAHTASINWS